MEAAGNLLMLPADSRLNLTSCDRILGIHLLCDDDVDNRISTNAQPRLSRSYGMTWAWFAGSDSACAVHMPRAWHKIHLSQTPLRRC
jgi:hypothetical protein